MAGFPSITLSGSTRRTQKFLDDLKRGTQYTGLESLAQRGVDALQAATPIETGLTANSWSYEIEIKDGAVSIYWLNSSRGNGWAPIAILLQYGHGTGTGGYVQGRDYINPALKPIFDEIANTVWKRVTSA